MRGIWGRKGCFYRASQGKGRESSAHPKEGDISSIERENSDFSEGGEALTEEG